MSIDGRERVIKTDDIGIVVQCASDVDSLFLSSTKVDTFFANLGHVARREDLEIALEFGKLDCFPVALLFPRLAEDDVVTQSRVLDPKI